MERDSVPPLRGSVNPTAAARGVGALACNGWGGEGNCGGMAREVPKRLVALVAVAGMCGCAGGGSQPAAPAQGPGAPARPAHLAASSMPPIERAERVQRVLRRQVSDAVRVGYVEQVDDGRIRILGADTFGLRAGGSLLFLDADRRPIAYGTILEADSDSVIASADPTLVERGRHPQRADLAAFNLGEPSAPGVGG